MWMVRDLQAGTATLDFSSSGGADHTVTQISVDGVMFANAAELSTWDGPHFQVRVCEECGIEHCTSGHWLVVRNVGVGVAFVPAFDAMLADEWAQKEYAPPFFAGGMPIFSPADYATLRDWCVGLPPIDAVPDLTGNEVLRWLQWEAPAYALGTFPADVDLDQDLLLAVSDGDVSDAAALLTDAIERARGASRALLEPVPSTARALTLYLSASGTPAWTPLYVIDHQVRLAAPTTDNLVGAG